MKRKKRLILGILIFELMWAVNCSLAQESTSRNFVVPSIINVVSGETASSEDGQYQITVNKMIDDSANHPVFNAADTTIQSGQQIKHIIINPGDVITMEGLRLYYLGVTPYCAFITNGIPFSKYQTERKMPLQILGTHLDPTQYNLDIPVGETADSMDGQYHITINKLVQAAPITPSLYYKEDLTIQFGNQKEHAIIDSGGTIEAGNIKIRQVGYKSYDGKFVYNFLVTTK